MPSRFAGERKRETENEEKGAQPGEEKERQAIDGGRREKGREAG